MKGRLLFLSYHFAPDPYPTANRAKRIAEGLDSWNIDLITASKIDNAPDHIAVHRVDHTVASSTTYKHQTRPMHGKILALFDLPDQVMSWTLSAYVYASRLVSHHDYDGVVVFMMPYSQGITGVWLKRDYRIPLILNLDDSLTCSDMHPAYTTGLHFKLYQWLEDWYVQNADSVIYTSKMNSDRVRQRNPRRHSDKFYVVRYGSDPLDTPRTETKNSNSFRLVYTGGTGGWYDFLDRIVPPSILKKTYRYLKNSVQYTLTELDHRTHGPVYVGKAIQRVAKYFDTNIYIDVFGHPYSQEVVNAVLDSQNLSSIVNIKGHIPHQSALRKIQEYDLLYMSLPDRSDGSSGGRISAKTYEYLMTDRPILAALPPGENREYLRDKPGVYISAPSDLSRMSLIISHLVRNKQDGKSVQVDRSHLSSHISWTARVRKFEHILQETLSPSIK